MKKIFINKSNQLRCGWKILLVFLAAFGLQLFISIIFGIASGIISTVSNTDYREVIASISGYIQYTAAISTILIVWLFFRYMEKKSLSQSGFTNIKGGFKDLLSGLLLGAVSMTVIFFTLLWTNNIVVKGSLSKPAYNTNLWSGLVLFIFVGIEEEYLFRGYIMNALSQTGNKLVAFIVSALIFSLAHGLNPNIRWMGLLNIFLVGILFAYMFMKTGSLWMPVGYHITWNYFQGNIFGFPVSGTAPVGIYTIANVKDNLVTGGGFGPEGGILTTIAIIICILIVGIYSKSINSRKLNLNL